MAEPTLEEKIQIIFEWHEVYLQRRGSGVFASYTLGGKETNRVCLSLEEAVNWLYDSIKDKVTLMNKEILLK